MVKIDKIFFLKKQKTLAKFLSKFVNFDKIIPRLICALIKRNFVQSLVLLKLVGKLVKINGKKVSL